jgi:hypothetical protein
MGHLGGSVEKFIARENIRRFEEQLAACADEADRAVLLKLLETERRRLHELEAQSAISAKAST